jgi:RNA polymerase sigma factor (sigma-70 family)
MSVAVESPVEIKERSSEEVFREIVERNIGLVYSTALRRVGGDATLAQDVTQIVFRDLALKRGLIAMNAPVTGWLYRHTCFTAAKAARAEARRRAREMEAATMETQDSESETSWDRIAPMLDGLMERLNPRERSAVVLRYFAGSSLGEVAGELGTTPEAARKLVSRGLAKLRSLLVKRGVTSTAAGLAAAIASGANCPVPIGMASAVSSFALAEAALPVVSTTALLIAFMAKLKTAALCAVSTVALSLSVWQAHQNDRLQALNDSLRAEMTAPRKLAASRAEAAVASESPGDAERRRKEFLELLRLRGEVAVMRARLGSKAASSSAPKSGAKTPPSDTAGAPQSFKATGTARVPGGQTLAMGGWLTPAGGRRFVFATPTINADSGGRPTVLIRTSFVEMTADAVNQAGFNPLLTDGGETQSAALYTKEQWDAQTQTLTNLDGVQFLAQPSVLTFGDGAPAKMGMTGSGTNYFFSVRPQITSEGGSVDLSYEATLEFPGSPANNEP